MAGHSKWANIKRRKGAQDVARGKLFTKLIKEIMVAAKIGGGDLDANPRLRLAVDKAKGQSMPRLTIERAIAKATGDLSAQDYEELIYEGYGPGGVAIMVACLTDNRNRTSSDIRHAFTKHGGNLGSTGSVSYMFKHVGLLSVAKSAADEETVMMAAIEGGGEDLEDDGDTWLVTCNRDDYDACQAALAEAGLAVIRSEVTRVPDTTVPVSGSDAAIVVKLLERLDDLDDVQETYTNAEIDESTLEA